MVLFVSYVCTGIFGLKLAAVNGFATSIWAPSGIALACLLKFGVRLWPAIALAAFFVNTFAGASLASAAVISVGNSLEGVIAFYILNKLCKDFFQLDRLFDVVCLIVFGSFLSTLISASLGVGTLWLASTLSSEGIGFTFLTWWLGDLAGILIVTPFILVWHSSFSNFKDWIWNQKEKWLRIVEIFLLIAIVIFLSNGIYEHAGIHKILRLHFLFPFLIWSAIRFGQRGATLTVMIISSIAIWGTIHGRGPFTLGSTQENLFNLLGFMIVFSTSALVLAAVITERKNAQRHLQENAQELERSNAELEQFASLASHDLKEPLRTISVRIEMLRENLKENSDPEIEEHIDFSVSAAKRMQALINALLSYGQAGKRQAKFSVIDLNLEINRIIDFMQTDIFREQAKLTLSSFPKIIADGILIGQVFQNLISNALKFKGPLPPEINIGWNETKTERIFYVKDNGIGFPMKYAESVFKIFQRLHSNDEVAGTGVGLALCKKIIEQHDGKIWVDSHMGMGSTFYFSIPKELEYKTSMPQR
ncbi:MAG: hypothetical protein JWQ35_1396 [Bacteriovoracaceae bacterium]|nr:hypothetical protein [Bacteriovoracaceae bacterium]